MHKHLFILVALAIILVSCSDVERDHAQSPPGQENISVDASPGTPLPTGVFTDDYDSRHDISSESWTQDSTYRYVFVQHLDRTVIARNDSLNPSEGGLYSRIDWITLSDNLPYTWAFCLTAYDATDFQAALDMPPADGTAPMTGCNGFPFTRMQPVNTTNQ